MAEATKGRGANPAKDDDKAAGEARAAGAKLEQANAAERDAVDDTTPAEVDVEGAGLIRAGDAASLTDYVEDVSTATTVVLKKDVLEEFFYPGTKRPSYRVLFHAGQTVLRSQLEAYIAAERDAKAFAAANPAGIDANTLASGTYPGIAAVAQEQARLGTTETK